MGSLASGGRPAGRVGRGPRSPLLFDAALAATVAALTWGTMVLDRGCACPVPGWAVAVVLGHTAPLVVRRRYPVAVWVVVGVATTVHGVSELADPALYFGGLVAVYTVASRCSRNMSYTLGAISGVTLLGAMAAAGDTALVHAAFNVVVFATAWILGDSVRVHRAYTAELERRAARLEEERAEQAERAAAEERARIARELHDVVAHHVSLIALQSQAADALLPTGPHPAADVVRSIGTAARQAMIELRRLLGVLREDDGEDERAPQPGISDIATLVQALTSAGLEVDLRIEGGSRQLPPGVDLSAYRIVQEALTNVAKHAGARRAEVVLCYGDADLTIRVSDDGTGAATANGAGDGPGHGLIGMRERVALFGGELAAGPDAGGGFVVDARLPVEP